MRVNRTYGGIMTRLAVEGIEAAATSPDDEVQAAPVEAGADSLEAELVEVNQDIVDVQADEAIVDDTAEVVEEAEETAVALESIAANGGLDRNGARVLNMLAVSLNKRLGYPANHGTLSIESFGGTADRVSTTRLAAESFSDKAKELWKKIVEMFRSAMQAVQNVWNRLFDGATRLKARAEKVKKAAEGAKDGSGNFENQKLADNLHIDGKVDVKAAATAILAESGTLAELSKRATEFANAATNEMTAGPQAENKEPPVSLVGKAKALASGGDFTKVADAASVGMGAIKDIELFRGKALPGNKAIIAFVPEKEDKDGLVALKSAGYKLGIFDASKKVGDKVELPVLSKSDIEKVASDMIATADKITAYKSAQKEAEAAGKKLISTIETLTRQTTVANRTEKGDGKVAANFEGWVDGVVGKAIAKGAMSMVTNAAPPLAAYALNTGAYVLQYAEQSLKASGAAAKADGKDAAKAEPAAKAA